MDYYKLDANDIQIIQLLAKDSRTTLSMIADTLGVSNPTVRSRVDKLVSLGIIQQFTLTLSYELLSEHPSQFLLVKTKPQAVPSVIDFLVNLDELLEVHELVGQWQVMARTTPLSMQEFHNLLQRLRQVEGVEDISTMALATSFKHDTARLPSKDILVKLRCLYCGKMIEKDYQTLVVDGVTQFFCCTSCLRAFKEERGINAT